MIIYFIIRLKLPVSTLSLFKVNFSISFKVCWTSIKINCFSFVLLVMRLPGMAEPRRFREMSTCVMSHRPGKGVTEEESDGHTKAYSYSFGRVKAKTALNKLIKAVNLRPVRVHNVNLQITTGCLNLWTALRNVSHKARRRTFFKLHVWWTALGLSVIS